MGWGGGWVFRGRGNGEVGWGGVCVCGGGGEVLACACVRGECPCGYLTFIFCKHKLVGITLDFTESKKLSLYSNLQIVLSFSLNIEFTNFGDLSRNTINLFILLKRKILKVVKNIKEKLNYFNVTDGTTLSVVKIDVRHLCFIWIVVKCLLCATRLITVDLLFNQ